MPTLPKPAESAGRHADAAEEGVNAGGGASQNATTILAYDRPIVQRLDRAYIVLIAVAHFATLGATYVLGAVLITEPVPAFLKQIVKYAAVILASPALPFIWFVYQPESFFGMVAVFLANSVIWGFIGWFLIRLLVNARKSANARSAGAC